ncbi:hypothetical protein OE88DRAFT_250209 [Heliocybe sulcata]|uniref:Uncharacterized protein n=1 Tax=Heliocybe sulcata TaxID=5364 RepID=A0A5C3MY12_9AGAM|nr:hypothetical protein OE88DRAFT_250209 [Heliocybe sulcata]
MTYSILSFPSLVGGPIAGAILSRQRSNYTGLIVFTGVTGVVGMSGSSYRERDPTWTSDEIIPIIICTRYVLMTEHVATGIRPQAPVQGRTVAGASCVVRTSRSPLPEHRLLRTKHSCIFRHVLRSGESRNGHVINLPKFSGEATV